MIPGVVWWCCGGVVFLPIIRPPQQKLFHLFLGCWFGCGNVHYKKLNWNSFCIKLQNGLNMFTKVEEMEVGLNSNNQEDFNSIEERIDLK